MIVGDRKNILPSHVNLLEPTSPNVSYLSADMSKVVHTLMHNAAERIVELSTALFGTGKAPKVANASMQALLLRLQSIST